jgi:sentrin-specific protease 1
MSSDEEDVQTKRRKIGETQPQRSAVLFSFNNIDFTTADSARIDDKNWLNDHVLSFWIWEIKKKMKGADKVFIFESSFMSVLLRDNTYDYERVKRWTTKRDINIFENNFLLVPAHVSGNHWILLVANLRERVVTVMNSLDEREKYLNLKEVLVTYLEDEFKTLKGIAPIDKHFEVVDDVNSPKQENGYDCGIFVLIFIERIVKLSREVEENKGAVDRKVRILSPVSKENAIQKRMDILAAVAEEIDRKEE